MTVGTNQALVVQIAPAAGGHLACDETQGCGFGTVRFLDRSKVLADVAVQPTVVGSTLNQTADTVYRSSFNWTPTAFGTRTITAQYLGTTPSAPSAATALRDPVAAIKELTGGKYADLTLDTSSNRDARLNAIRSTKVWGTMCFVGEGGDVTIDVSPHLLRRQMTLIASWTFSTVIQAECAAFCIERKIDVDKLFTHRWSLDQAEEAYKLFDKQSDGKGVFLI